MDEAKVEPKVSTPTMTKQTVQPPASSPAPKPVASPEPEPDLPSPASSEFDPAATGDPRTYTDLPGVSYRGTHQGHDFLINVSDGKITTKVLGEQAVLEQVFGFIPVKGA